METKHQEIEWAAMNAVDRLLAAMPGAESGIDYMMVDGLLTPLNRALALLQRELNIPHAAIAEFVQAWAAAHGAPPSPVLTEAVRLLRETVQMLHQADELISENTDEDDEDAGYAPLRMDINAWLDKNDKAAGDPETAGARAFAAAVGMVTR